MNQSFSRGERCPICGRPDCVVALLDWQEQEALNRLSENDTALLLGIEILLVKRDTREQRRAERERRKQDMPPCI